MKDGAAPPATAGEARALWRQWMRGTERGAGKPLRLGLAATFTAEPLAPLLGAALLAEGFAPELRVGPYNQLFQVCLDPEPHLGACDAIVLLWRMEELLESAEAPRPEEQLELLQRALRGLRAKFAGAIIVNTPAFPTTWPEDLRDPGNASGLGALHRRLVDAWLKMVSEVEGMRVWDLDALQRQAGLAASSDARQWYLYRQPFADRFLWEMGQGIARLLAALHRPPRKCLAVDGDNTLWGGIIGEDGIEGVQIGEDFPGSAHRDLQRLLLRRRAEGVLLALVSKNNEPEVRALMEGHSGMLLRPADFAAWRVNWRSKSENLVELARELNLGLESFVFLDDNPLEIESMRAALPQVLCVQLPEDPAEWLAALRGLTCFDRLEVTREDRERTGMMQVEQTRQAVAARMDEAEFLRSLGLKVSVFRAGPGELERVAQLINKTNQFNLTTRRRTLEEVRALAASAEYGVYGVRIEDRFGAYGLTGVAVVRREVARKVWAIDTFLLSCRVLGRQVETAVLAVLAGEAAAAGAEWIEAEFVPSAKNAPAAGFLGEHGFREGENGWWKIAVAETGAAPPFIALE
jgi:FkbH-like protein